MSPTNENHLPSAASVMASPVNALREPASDIRVPSTASNSIASLIDALQDLVAETSPDYNLSVLSEAIDIRHPPTASEWKTRGDDLFKKKKMTLAKESYVSGLEICQEKEVNIRKQLNLGVLAVYFEEGYLEKAIEIGKEILSELSNDDEALLQLGRAYYAARRFDEAFECYQHYSWKLGNLKGKRDEIERIHHRIGERRRGQFKFGSMLRIGLSKSLREIECADYQGPIAIKEIAGKGRGLVLTEDVKQDTFLIVSKAVAAVLQDESTTMDEETLQILQPRLVAKLLTLICKNPNLFGSEVFNLCSHPTEFQLDPIRRDIRRLQNICYLNQRVLWRWDRREETHNGIGLFITPSYMNHHCQPNVKYRFYNDVMVISSNCALKAGTELTTCYPRENWTYQRRKDYLRSYGIECNCEKCLQEL